MKKILFLFIVVFSVICANKINLNAEEYNMLKKLYIVSDSYDTLDYPGYKLIETDIDFHLPGIYSATYLEEITGRKFIREIEVVSSFTLLNNGIKNVNLKEEIKIDNAVILKRVTTNTCNVIVYEKDKSVYLNYQYKDSSKDIYLFNRETFGFVDLKYSKEHNKLYLIGNLFTSSLDIYIGEFNLNGILLNEKIFKGNGVDNVCNMHITSNVIFLTGYTTSIDGDFNHTGYLEDSFIFKIDIRTFEIIKYLNLGIIGNDYIKTSAYLDSLYVIKHSYDRGIPIVQVIKVDNELNILDSNYLGTITNITDVKLKEANNSLYYFCNVYDEKLNDDVSTLYKITKELSIRKIDSYYDKLSKAVDINIVNDEISLLYTSSSKEENYPTYLRIINDLVTKFTLDNRIYNKCYFNELGNLDLLYDEYLKSFEYSLVFAKTLGSNNSNEDISPLIMCNNHQITEDNYLSKINFDQDIFGTYNLIYYYKFDFFDLVFRKDIRVESNVLVADENYYSEGLILTFKGKAYLNNILIESGYVIEEKGDYELKIIGYNDETLIYNFSIIETKTSKNIFCGRNPSFELNLKEQENFNNLDINNKSLINNIVPDDYDNNIWYIIIPICTLLVSVSTFMFIGRKIK